MAVGVEEAALLAGWESYDEAHGRYADEADEVGSG
jgi:hypothetical protein